MTARRERPNILVIMSDQHSKHVLGCYGNDVVRTPNLDRLAVEGMLLTDAYCPAPLCVPSRMSFMTGRTPSRNACWDNGQILSSAIPTWAHDLGAAGYETALIGRMHFVGPDQRHGFARRPIGELTAGHPGAPNPTGATWRPRVVRGNSQDRRSVEIAGHGHTLYQWFDEQVTSAACEYLRGRARHRSDGPFVAVVGYLLPHNPYVAPKELFDDYYRRVDIPPVDENPPPSVRRMLADRSLSDPPLPEERVRLARAAYFGLCEHLDGLVGQVLACLAETHLADDTLVIYCSDHGDMAGEHGCWAKSCFHEGSVGVPLIARLPGTIPAGSRSDAVCNLMDLGPTFADAAGVEPIADIDGRSLWPVLTGNRPNDWPDETFSELLELASWPRKPIAQRAPSRPARMIRSGRWKLWVFADEDHLPPVLFDLRSDPGELIDMADDPACAAVRDELVAKVHAGWDPDYVRRAGRESDLHTQALRRWGQVVKPTHEDALPFPADDIESDVVLP